MPSDPQHPQQFAETVSVPKATYDALCSIVRMWDAWLLTGKQDNELRRAAARMTAAFCGSEAGARAEELADLYDGCTFCDEHDYDHATWIHPERHGPTCPEGCPAHNDGEA